MAHLLHINFNYLATAFGFMGITDITFIDVENDEFGGQKLANGLVSARIQVAQLVGG